MTPTTRAARPEGSSLLSWSALAVLAIVLPTAIAFNVAPSATFFNQAAAYVGWGCFLLVIGACMARRMTPRSGGALALLGSLALLTAAAVIASPAAAVPWPLSLSNVGTLLAALLTAAIAASAQRVDLGERAFRACCIALVVAGVVSSFIGLLQVFAPNLPDGDWIAVAAIPGRATGNLRQPNHLSSLLLWSIVAVVWLGERRIVYREIAAVLAFLFVWVVMLSASRTGAIGIAVLAGWGLLDRRLSRTMRLVLLATPLVFALAWGGTALWSHATNEAFGAEARFTGSGIYVSYSRYAIWANSLAMIAMHPWLGVGFGEFNFAWSLTPFPDRPVAFFDHAHNIVLHFAVELGVPLAALVLGLMGYALWRAFRNALDSGRVPGAVSSRLRGADAASDSGAAAAAAGGPMQRAAFVMVLLVGLHSLLEYPLWYAYFLLPAAFFFGLCLEQPDAAEAAAAARPGESHATRPFVLAAMALILGGTLAVYDYMRVVVIFAPPANAGPLEQRIADGRRSVLFAHHADYAAATVTDHPGKVMKAFQRAPHYLLDARLMQAWVTALEENGEFEKASYLAARLREFRNEQSAEFFASCAPPAPLAGNAPDPMSFAAAAASASPAAASAPPAPASRCHDISHGLTYADFR